MKPKTTWGNPDGGGLAFSFPITSPEDPTIEAEITVPPGVLLWGDVVNYKGTDSRGNWSGTVRGSPLEEGGNRGGFSYIAPFYWDEFDEEIDSGRMATNATSEPLRFRISMGHTADIWIGEDDRPASASLQNLRFIDADGNEVPACPDADLERCIANGGNLFLVSPVDWLGSLLSGCVDLDSPWLGFGLTLAFVEDLIETGILIAEPGSTASEVLIGLHATFTAVEQVTNGCFNAFGDLIASIGDIAGAVVELANDPEAFLGEQMTLIRQTVNEAVTDPDEFISQALAAVLRLDLLQENPLEWLGTIGCELVIEVLLAATGAGAAAVAARLADRVSDFIRVRRGIADGDGDNGGLPPTCVLRSFSADTEVLLANGETLPIAEVVVGDMVFAHDPETGAAGPRTVTAVWPHQDTLVEYEVGNATVTTTEDHEFWNVTDQAWQETQHIDPGDLLLTAEGQTVEAGNILWDTAHRAPAFDLTIEGIHTYHVSTGDESVLVHNQGPVEWIELEDGANVPELARPSEYLFDADTGRLVLSVSPNLDSHLDLAEAAGIDIFEADGITERIDIVGGELNGTVFDETSGNFGRNWTAELRSLFRSRLLGLGTFVEHFEGFCSR